MEQPAQNQTPRGDQNEQQQQHKGRSMQSQQKPIWARPITWIGVAIVAAGAVVAILMQMGVINMSSFGANGAGNTDNTVIATVNDEEITQAQLDDRITQLRQNLGSQNQSLDAEQETQLRDQALQNLINEVLVLQEAENASVAVTDANVSQALDQIKTRFETDQAYQTELTNNNLTETQLRERIRRELVVQQYLSQNVSTSSITVSDEEVQNTYDQAASQGGDLPALADVREQIVAQIEQQKLQQLIQQLIQQLRNNADIQTNL